jgi:hypothetical protein
MQMAYQQIVRMTQCEDTRGFPVLLREMLSYLGYVWYPEYRVTEIPRGDQQHRYRAEVHVPADDLRYFPEHFAEATASSVEMAVQRVAYCMIITLRSTYTCFESSPYRYVPSGVRVTQARYHTGGYADPEQENSRLFMTAQFVQCQDRFTQALLHELDSVTEQLWRTRQHLAAYTTPQPSHPSYPQSVRFPPTCAPSDVGGYVPDRGQLLSVDPHHRGPLLYGEQGPEAHSLYTPRLHLPVDQHSRGRRRTNRHRGDYQPMG